MSYALRGFGEELGSQMGGDCHGYDNFAEPRWSGPVPTHLAPQLHPGAAVPDGKGCYIKTPAYISDNPPSCPSAALDANGNPVRYRYFQFPNQGMTLNDGTVLHGGFCRAENEYSETFDQQIRVVWSNSHPERRGAMYGCVGDPYRLSIVYANPGSHYQLYQQITEGPGAGMSARGITEGTIGSDGTAYYDGNIRADEAGTRSMFFVISDGRQNTNWTGVGPYVMKPEECPDVIGTMNAWNSSYQGPPVSVATPANSWAQNQSLQKSDTSVKTDGIQSKTVNVSDVHPAASGAEQSNPQQTAANNAFHFDLLGRDLAFTAPAQLEQKVFGFPLWAVLLGGVGALVAVRSLR